MRLHATLALLAMTFAGCKTSDSSAVKGDEAGSTASTATWSDFESGWQAYSDSISQRHPYELQGRCRPILQKPQGEPKGVALFFHGFTACPMQFIPFAERLTAMGYYVIVPLLPGQGRGPTPLAQGMNLKDGGTHVGYSQYYARYLPTAVDDYTTFIDQMNHLVARAPGRHVVGGLSVGGAMALNAILIAEERGLPDLYDASLALSPFLAIPGLYLGRKPGANPLDEIVHALQRPVGDAIYQLEMGLVQGAQSIGALAQIPASFGKGCYASICGGRLPECVAAHPELKGSQGRDAICDFTIGNLGALQAQGEAIQKRFRTLLQKGWVRTKFQLVGTEFDHSADSAPMVAVGSAIAKQNPSHGRYCIYKPVNGIAVPHVLFDLTEQPFFPMPWRPSFMDQAMAFLDHGAFFAEDPGTEHTQCHVPLP